MLANIFILLWFVVFSLSCKKELSCVGCNEINQPPVACAGTDQVIAFPLDSIYLDGGCSTDPESNIKTYQWKMIEGPTSATIINAISIKTKVNNLERGIYLFELEVKDAEGLFSKDTVQVSVSLSLATTCDGLIRPVVLAQLVPIGNLSKARSAMSVISAGNKILFAGGYNDSLSRFTLSLSSRVDIYDIPSNSWTIGELSEKRISMAMASLGNKVFFGGGDSFYISTGKLMDCVDIYDVTSKSWSVKYLSVAGTSLASAAVGNKVLFAGGLGLNGKGREKRVDIYDLTTDDWSTSELSEMKRGGHTAVVVDNKIYIAGGQSYDIIDSFLASNRIDIYDPLTNRWSESNMALGKSSVATIAVGNNIYWAGGTMTGNDEFTPTCTVEIRNVITGNSSVQNLFSPHNFVVHNGNNAVFKDNKIIFYRSYGEAADKFDIYDIASNSWSIGILPIKFDGASIIAVNNVIYLAGGSVNSKYSSQVWKIEF